MEFPIQSQTKGYNLKTLRQDSYAGLMVAFLLVPQAIAYAILAGVPAVHGLYASIFPMLVYSLVGSSPLLSVGPVAVVSIMVFTGLASIVSPDAGIYLSVVASLSLMVGMLQILLSVLQFGTLLQFVPSSVLVQEYPKSVIQLLSSLPFQSQLLLVEINKRNIHLSQQ
ncbi:SulP family inorganic anion transporter [Salibacterium salarium]|uniref:SulP family inorganic anion transporter n=1 Tax=Salibacterium salarium TaxID=284579 RepID=UPI000F7B5A9B|nr:SulP family inorganic anion transporter [Salibacterium salarium]